MRMTVLQRASLILVGSFVVLGAAGAVGFQAFSQSGDEAHFQPGKAIPSRSDCINEGLRDAQSRGFSRQTAYDIEVRCEQLIQSLEGHKAARR